MKIIIMILAVMMYANISFAQHVYVPTATSDHKWASYTVNVVDAALGVTLSGIYDTDFDVVAGQSTTLDESYIFNMTGSPNCDFDCTLTKTVSAPTSLKLEGTWLDGSNNPLSPLTVVTPDEEWTSLQTFSSTGNFSLKFHADELDATTCNGATLGDIGDHIFTLTVTIAYH